jgi:hypothetical protein
MVTGMLFHLRMINVHIVNIPTFKDVRSWLCIDDLDTKIWCDSRDMYQHIWNVGKTRQYFPSKTVAQTSFTIYTMDQRPNNYLNTIVNSLTTTNCQEWKGTVLVVKNSSNMDEVTDIFMEDYSEVTLILKAEVTIQNVFYLEISKTWLKNGTQ